MGIDKTKKAKQTNLISQEWNDRVFTGVDLPWRGSPEIVATQGRFFDQVLALAGIPEHDQLPKILAISEQHDMPLIWRRARLSPLENSAAAVLTALAFTHHKDWPQLIKAFFKSHNLSAGLRGGRPRLHPRDMKDMDRGIQIDNLIARLEKGFEIKLSAKRVGGFASGDEQTAVKLRDLGYDGKEIKEILKSKTLQDAGCRLFLAIPRKNGESVDLHTIRNSYARYKLLPGVNPPPNRKC
jgi:hypothetical protein